MARQVMRIGVLGCGSIGGFLARHILTDANLELCYVFDKDASRLQELPRACRVTSEQEIYTRQADLVVEAAHTDLVKAVAARLLEHSDLLLFSVTSFADAAFHAALERKSLETGHRVYLPHGAIIGIDGLVDAGPTLKSVTITTTKSPASLGLPPDTHKVVYEGPTRGACALFPRNVNVHASIAIAGLGFDRTLSRIVSDPSVTTNSHVVEVVGDDYLFRIQVSSEAGGKVTGAYTPQSALSTLQRLCNHGGGVSFA